MQDANVPRLLGDVFVGDLSRKRSWTSFFASPQAAIPQVHERRVACLQRGEAETVPVAANVRAIVLLDERVDAAPRFPRRFGHPAGEEHVVLGLEPLQLGFETQQVAFDLGGSGHSYRGIRSQT